MSRFTRTLDRLERVLALAEEQLGRHRRVEYGPSFFESHLAFRWEGSIDRGRLVAIEAPSLFELDDLVGVDQNVAKLVRNTEQHVRGLPSNNVLLYGERGTGKSSAVKGLLARFGGQGLRIVEVHRDEIVHLPHVIEAIHQDGGDHRFLLFTDDLSFSPGEVGYRELKAALDGGLEARPDNVCIVATSNRRHLLPQSMAENREGRLDDEGELHLGEALEEKLALADRFGLVLGFFGFDQAPYLSIVSHNLDRASMGEMDDIMREEALRWALARGNRSGRTARQFVDDAVGRRKLGSQGFEP